MLTPPIIPMLARSEKVLPRPGALPGGVQYEAKMDGFRALIFTGSHGVHLQSRSGSILYLTRAFPEVAAAAATLSGEETVLDGELVVQQAGRLDFPALQERARQSGLNAQKLAAAMPAHAVLFDVLQLSGQELLKRPLGERRRALEELFARRELGAPWVLCPATTDVTEARQWLEPTWAQVGVEGCVCKGLGQSYWPGERRWVKVRSYQSAEAVIGAVTGSLARPSGVLLGRYDTEGHLRLVARSTPLPAPLRKELASLLGPAEPDHPWQGARFSAGWGTRETLQFTCVRPELVAEFSGDAAFDQGRYRHPVQVTRLRGDLGVNEVEPFAPQG